MFSDETTNTNFIVFGLTLSGLEPTIYHIRGEHANHYTTDATRTYVQYQERIAHDRTRMNVIHMWHDYTIVHNQTSIYYTCNIIGLLLMWTTAIKFNLADWSSTHHHNRFHLIEYNLLSPWDNWILAHLVLYSNHSLTHSLTRITWYESNISYYYKTINISFIWMLKRYIVFLIELYEYCLSLQFPQRLI